jgi:thermitase
MLLVAIAPAINGLQLEKSSDLEPPKPITGGTDLRADISRCEFIEYSITGNKVKYEIDWAVDNIGSGYYWGCECVLRVDDRIFDRWDAYSQPPPTGCNTFGTRILWLKSSEDPSVDEERYFAGKIVTLEIDSYDDNLSNNIDKELAKWWKGDNFIPTDPEVEVSAPHWYKQIYSVPEIPDLFYLEFFDVRYLPNILQSQRTGWAGQAAKYLAIMGTDVTTILGCTVAFLFSISDDVKVLAEWIIDIIEWFANAIKGIFYGGIIEIIHDFRNYVWDAIIDIFEKGIAWGGTVAVLSMKFLDDCNTFYNWTLDDPWTKPITILGRVDGVERDEVVTVHCRNETIPYNDDDGDGTIYYSLTVTSEPIGNEHYKEGVHNCKVTVFGSKHNGESKSGPILSYAFANGSLYWHFTSPGDSKIDGKTKDARVLKQFLVDKLKDWLKNRPLTSLLEKILSKTKVVKETEQHASSITSDSDLDTLMKKVKEEKYEPYDGLEYKPYYSGAPRDPNVVYFSSDQVLVGFKSYVDITQIEEVEGYPVVDKIPELNTVIVEIYGIDPEQFVEIAENLTDVEYAELNYVYQSYFTPNDYYWDSQWGPKAINCPEAWDIEKGSSLAKVAIIDTGCNYNHNDIRCKESYVNYDFVNDDDDPMDDNGHGTHCAGIIGATMNNALGIAGVSQSFTDYIKVLDGSGAGYASTVAKGIVHAAKNMGGCAIISMSLGGYGLSILVHAACDYAYYIKGVVLVAAAGNDGLPRVGYPARFDSVIAVGAVGENLELCSWSNYGPDVDLVAPGEDIISTFNNGYERLSGTSMACPHVAGVAALYFSKNSDATAAVCRGKLLSTAKDLGSPGKDIYYGYGLVNAYEMVSKKPIARDNILTLLDHLPKLKQLITNSQILQQIIKALSK